MRGAFPKDRTPEELRYELRSKLRWITPSAREKTCGVVSFLDQGPGIECRGRPGAWRAKWVGLSHCGHIWTCPVCSARKREVRLARVVRAVEHSGGRWQMVTLTVRHKAGMPLRSLLGGMMAAWRRARQGGATQRIWSERVTGSVRATEITHGQHGWHPHLHVLLRTTEWSPEERDALFDRWQRAVLQHLGPECVPNEEHAITWSNPIDVERSSDVSRAAYIAKLGLEIVGSDKRGRHGSRSAWGVAWAAAEGDPRAVQLWREYYTATRGRRMLELDDRASQWAKIPREIVVEVPRPETVIMVQVDTIELRALRQFERRQPSLMAVISADATTANDPKATVDGWIRLVINTLSRSPAPLAVARPP